MAQIYKTITLKANKIEAVKASKKEKYTYFDISRCLRLLRKNNSTTVISVSEALRQKIKKKSKN